MSETCAIVIDKLIEERHNKGMTQKELAKATDLTQSVTARLESKKATPQLDTLVKVVLALDCRIEIVPIKQKKQQSRTEPLLCILCEFFIFLRYLSYRDTDSTSF